MLYAGYSIKKSIDLLINYKKTLTEKTEIIKMKTRLDSELSLMYKMANELLNILLDNSEDKSYVIALKILLEEGLSAIPKIENHLDTIEIIDKFLSFQSIGLDNIDIYDCISVIRELSIDAFNVIEELSEYDCNRIMNNINMSRDFNIFSSRARKGITLDTMKKLSNEKASLYALEEKDNLFKECREKCDRTIKGLLTGSRISNDVFDMMVLTPKVSWEVGFTQTNSLAEKAEKAMLRHHIKHLRPNGIFIYTIPYNRLTRDLAMALSKALAEVRVIKKENRILEQIIIVGIKKQSRDAKEDIYKMLCELEYDKIEDTFEHKYNLAAGGIKTPDFFRGSSLDEEELQSLINNSGLMASFWDKNKIDTEKKSARPLLPFNMGQIGLVLTSGCLDGIVEEYEGQYHAIKGMVTKIRQNSTTDEGNNEEVNIETISNKVQINIITPDGEFIELA